MAGPMRRNLRNRVGNRMGSPVEEEEREPPRLIYDCQVDVPNFSEKFPNAFIQPNLVAEERFDLIRDKNFKIIPSPAHANRIWEGNPTTVRVFVSFTAVLLPASRELTEEERLNLWIAVSHREDNINLGNISACFVNALGNVTRTLSKGLRRESMTAEQAMNYTSVNQAQAEAAYFALWKFKLLDLWNSNDLYFPDNVLRMRIQLGRDSTHHFRVHPEPLYTLARTMRHLLESGERSDFTIKCGPTEFRVHELILAARSTVFSAMFAVNMAERERRETTITDVNPHAFKMMLEYIYTSQIELEDQDFKTLCELVLAAEKYQLEELKAMCFKSLIQQMNIENVGQLLQLVHRCKATEKIRSAVVGYSLHHFDTLRRDAEFQVVMRECLDEFFKP